MSSSQSDVVIIGGGIVGLATAWQLHQRDPSVRMTLLEKEPDVAVHQTGRNSGVLHSGIYYRPDSLRARNCHQGRIALQEFCSEYGVAWQQTGKVIVAVTEDEVPRLRQILDRGRQNGVTCRLIEREELHELEPHCAGLKAIHVPEAGIVDYTGVCRKLAELLRLAGHHLAFNTQVKSIRQFADRVELDCTSGTFAASQVVNCCGLFSDRIARKSGQQLRERIVPFRGEYYELRPEAEHLCRSLIYPVPDPRFPFLGVHFTRMVQGGVECGPNAVLALAREGYTWKQINLRDLAESLTYPGFLRLAAGNLRTGLQEIHRSLSKAAFVRSLQKLIPEIREEHLTVGPSGVRAQLLGRDGKLIDDFVVQRQDRVVNVCNAASPAATACLNIGRLVADCL
ncbi:MAG: L-2-hydroxyglutarate oxidase [Planctomycetaceae bacterium]